MIIYLKAHSDHPLVLKKVKPRDNLSPHMVKHSSKKYFEVFFSVICTNVADTNPQLSKCNTFNLFTFY